MPGVIALALLVLPLLALPVLALAVLALVLPVLSVALLALMLVMALMLRVALMLGGGRLRGGGSGERKRDRSNDDLHAVSPSDFEWVRDRQEIRGGGGSASGLTPLKVARKAPARSWTRRGIAATAGGGDGATTAQARAQSIAVGAEF